MKTRDVIRVQKGAFTVIELLVLIVVMATLAVLIFSGYRKSVQIVQRMGCVNHLRRIMAATYHSLTDNGGIFPYRGDSWLNYGMVADQLLPYVGGDISVFACPANTHPSHASTLRFPSHPESYCHYEFNARLGNFDGGGVTRRLQGVTEPSRAAYVYDYRYWDRVNRPHIDGVNVGFMDGHVAFLNDTEMAYEGPEAEKFYNLGHCY